MPAADPTVVAPTPTPFSADDSVDLDALARNIERWLDTPLSGFVLTTANGEELALSEQERIEIVRIASQAHGGRRFTIAGIDNPSTRETLRLAERYARAGADMARVRVPRGLSDNAVVAYFQAVAQRSPIPVIVIHQTFSGIPAASPETLGAVCAQDNVFGYITDHDYSLRGVCSRLRPRKPPLLDMQRRAARIRRAYGRKRRLHVAWQHCARPVHGHYGAGNAGAASPKQGRCRRLRPA